MVLTEKQRRDLHVAILEYLTDGGQTFRQTTEVFMTEAGLSQEAIPNGSGLLEKKWTSVVRLQKKVLELEERLAVAEAELKSGGHSTLVPGGRGGLGAGADGQASRNLPRGPPKHVLPGHRGAITCLAIHPIFALLVSGSEDATIKTWDLESGEYEKTLKGHTNAVQGVAFNRAGTLLASCSSDVSIKLWDFNAGSSYDCLRTLRGHDHNISGVVFMPSGEQVLSCSRDSTIKFWEVSTGYCIRTFVGHSDWVRCMAVNSDGTLLASGGNDQSIIIWAVSSGTQVTALRDHTHVIQALAFPPPGVELKLDGGSNSSKEARSGEDMSLVRMELLVSGSRDKTVRVFNVMTGQCLMSFSDHDNWVRGLAIHPSGHYVLSCSDDRTIRILDLTKARCIRTLNDAHQHFVTSVVQHPSLPWVASGGVDKLIHIFECR